MPEQIEAKLLTGFEFLRHPDNPALGLLHLMTEPEDVWVLVTRKDLLSLAALRNSTKASGSGNGAQQRRRE